MAVKSYRDIPKDRVLKFPTTPGFKGWEPFFTDESTTHPAKMNLNLLRWILETYTEPGEIVLDPMAGTGSTIVLASILGRHGIAVEYEPRFCDMIRANIELTRRQRTLTPKGKMICIQGDARELTKLLKETNAIITSPPYAQTLTGGGQVDKGGYKQGQIRDQLLFKDGYGKNPENIGNLSYGDIDTIVTSPPFGPSTKGGGIFREGYRKPGEEEVSDPGLPQRHGRPLSDDPRNIDNLEYGDVDAVITSPPYEGSVPAYDEKWLEEHWDDESNSPKHKTMRFGRSMRGYPKKVDTVVTSPPYAHGLRHRGQNYEEVRKKLLARGYSEEYIRASWSQHHQCQRWAEEAYGEDERNIGNLPHGDIDAVVTSPPYGNRLADDVVHDGDEARMSYRQAIDSIVTSPPYETTESMKDKEWFKKHRDEFDGGGITGEYAPSEDNIGNLKGETYLEAMLKVYRECHKVLKPAGKLIVVVKNFIRDKQVVRLDEDTIKLCEASGFRLADRWYFKLPTRSFWRILYRRKYPHVPEVEFEDVLVFEKGFTLQGGKVK